jgi:TetR/AcrR family transcriptional regulator, cholesterol catabolism regulator
MADGTFAITDPALAATFLLSALNGVAGWYRPDGRLTADRIADHFVDLAVRALTEAHR